MRVASEQELADGLDAVAGDPGLSAPPVPGGLPAPAAHLPGPSADETDDASGGPDAADAVAEPALAQLSAAVRELAGAAERYHDRAAQREGVIDYLRSELETAAPGRAARTAAAAADRDVPAARRPAAAGRHPAAGL